MSIKLMVDLSIWKKEVAIRHTKEWLIFAPFYAIGSAGLTCGLIYGREEVSIWFFILALGLSLITAMGSVWFLFDGFFQVFRGWITKMPKLFTWFGLGSVDGKSDAKSDTFLRRFTQKQQIIMKWCFLIVPIGIYIVTLTHG